MLLGSPEPVFKGKKIHRPASPKTDQRQDFGPRRIVTTMLGWPLQKSEGLVRQGRRHAGTDGELEEPLTAMREDLAVIRSKSLPRSTKTMCGGSAFAPTEVPNAPLHTRSRTLLTCLTSPFSVRTACVPMGCGTESVQWHMTICCSFWLKPWASHDHCRPSL